ncbi:MAG: pyridoxal kinase PdxY [Rickettsiella sp.]|nr:pyridoxal kinase PdxY [Rickettsiella sp.]
MNILSIQSHVSYGYVGNKAATFPLQSLGFEVWPINTVQFSNHTGYGFWRGEVFSAQHIHSVIQGLESLNLAQKCDAILSGYIGDKAIGKVILNTVNRFRTHNPGLCYLCDPVMGEPGGKGCFVKQDIPAFFREQCLNVATIITPNHFEAEILWTKKINNTKQLQQASTFFHSKGVSIVAITRLQLNNINNSENYSAFLSIKNRQQWLAIAPAIKLTRAINGTGDLFSALYLGHFLLTKDPVMAFQQAMNTTHKILVSTAKVKKRELQIIGNNYCDPAPNTITLIPL